MTIEMRMVKGDELALAREVEKKAFLEEGFPYYYGDYNDQSIMFGAFASIRWKRRWPRRTQTCTPDLLSMATKSTTLRASFSAPSWTDNASE